MSWLDMVHELNLPNEESFIKLLKRTPAPPLIYILRVQDKIKVESSDYYTILMKKYEEENYKKLYEVAREYEYVLRKDRERKKGWQ